MNAQLELPLNRPKRITVAYMIREHMADGRWTRLEWIKEYCLARYDRMVSECTISARLRDTPELAHEIRKRPQGSAVEYRLKLEAL